MKRAYNRLWYLTLMLLALTLGAAACAYPMLDPAATEPDAPNVTEDAEAIPVSIALTAAPAFLPLDLAQALGYFADEGLDVELRYVEGGSDAAAALENSSVNFSGNSLDHVLQGQVADQSLRMIMAFLDQPCVTLVVRSDLADAIQSPSDLRGHTVGVTRVGSATHILAVAVAAQAGVPASDFEVVEVGAAAMPDALTSGGIDTAVGVPPYTTRLIAAGDAMALVDLCQPDQAEAAIGGGLPFTGLLTREDVIVEQPEVVQRMVNALVNAQLFITSHSAQEIAAELPTAVTGDDAATYIDGLEAMLPAFSQTGGLVDPAGLGILLRLHQTFGTISADDEVNLNALYDNQFVAAALEH